MKESKSQKYGYEGAACYYDYFSTVSVPLQERIEFFEFMAKRYSGCILEIGAGTGQIALMLADMGFNIWCLERSPAMRSILLGKLWERPCLYNRVTVFPGDAESFRVRKRFSLIFAVGVMDHLLTDKDRLIVLQNVRRHLQRGGCFTFAVAMPHRIDEERDKAAHQIKLGEITVRRTLTKMERVTASNWDYQWTYQTYYGSKLIDTRQEQHLSRIDTPKYWFEFLKKAGYTARACYAGYNRMRFWKTGINPGRVLFETLLP